MFFNVENLEEIDLLMILSKKAVTRFWEVVITQVSFAEQPPPGCLQYHTGIGHLNLQIKNLKLNFRTIWNGTNTKFCRQRKTPGRSRLQYLHQTGRRILQYRL